MQLEVAYVVDLLGEIGGAEKTLLAALELFPKASIYTPVYNRDVFKGTEIARRSVITSFIDHLPYKRTQYRNYLPLMPLAISLMNLDQFKLILSFNYAVAHGVRVRPGQIHISYTHTPLRYAWRNYPVGGRYVISKLLRTVFLRSFRKWDYSAARRVHQFAAVSHSIANWIQIAYQRRAQVIYPPVEVTHFSPQYPRQNYYITVARLVAHKRVDLVVEAFRQLDLPLLVVGDGPEFSRLQQRASPNIHFTGRVPDRRLCDLLARSKAFVSSAEEDFGIAIVEAQAAGCPVISYGMGGALETVVDGETGLFFHEQTVDSLIDAVEFFERQVSAFQPDLIRANAQRFNKTRFLEEMMTLIQRQFTNSQHVPDKRIIDKTR